MSFVHGHARRTGWVVAHRRAPHRSESGQLALLPGPRPPPTGGGRGVRLPRGERPRLRAAGPTTGADEQQRSLSGEQAATASAATHDRNGTN